MPSPFPGMNPYLEGHTVWHDFHESFIPAIREAIAASAPANFVVRIDDHIYVHDIAEDDRRFIGRSDVSISALDPSDNGGGVATLLAPTQVQLVLDLDEERVSFIEIRDRDSWEVITVIEVLSPSNKDASRDRGQYSSKRCEILISRTHLVEIDLLRGGTRLPLGNPPRCDYCVLVSRQQQRPKADFWPIQLRERLPIVPIPLTEQYPDVPLDLQAILHRVYDGARYGNHVYRNEPEPALRNEDRVWAQGILAPAVSSPAGPTPPPRS